MDLAKTVVAVAEPEGLAEPAEVGLRYGGLVLGLAGLGVLALWLLAPRRPIRGSRGGRRSELEPGASSM